MIKIRRPKILKVEAVHWWSRFKKKKRNRAIFCTFHFSTTWPSAFLLMEPSTLTIIFHDRIISFKWPSGLAQAKVKPVKGQRISKRHKVAPQKLANQERLASFISSWDALDFEMLVHLGPELIQVVSKLNKYGILKSEYDTQFWVSFWTDLNRKIP